MGKIEKILERKKINETKLQRIYKRDLPHLVAIRRNLGEKWGSNASFADAISFLLEIYIDNNKRRNDESQQK